MVASSGPRSTVFTWDEMPASWVTTWTCCTITPSLSPYLLSLPHTSLLQPHWPPPVPKHAKPLPSRRLLTYCSLCLKHFPQSHLAQSLPSLCSRIIPSGRVQVPLVHVSSYFNTFILFSWRLHTTLQNSVFIFLLPSWELTLSQCLTYRKYSYQLKSKAKMNLLCKCEMTCPFHGSEVFVK